MMSDQLIEPLSEKYFLSLYRVLDILAREKKFLVFTEAPSVADAFDFYRHIVDNDLSHFIALNEDQAIGWCDVLPLSKAGARAHVGTLGIGLLPDFRHLGIGARLCETAIQKARHQGLTRIELTVRSDNLDAIALYRKFGFETESLQRRALRIDGRYYDMYAMALLL